MKRVLISSLFAIGTAVATFLVLVILAVEEIYSVTTATGIAFPLVMGYGTFRACWEKYGPNGAGDANSGEHAAPETG